MILVTGATGTIGTEVVRLLVARGLPARALVRDRSRAALPEGVELAVGDLSDPRSLDAALSGVERVLLVPPRDAGVASLEENLRTAALSAGVRHVVRISVIGAGNESTTGLQKMHAGGEQALEASGLAWTHLRPNSFFQNFLLFAGPIAADGAFAFSGGRLRLARIDARDVSSVAVEVLASEGHDGRAYELTGPECLSMEEVAARLSKMLGRAITYVELAPVELEAELVGAGWPSWAARITVEAYCEALPGSTVVTCDVELVTGRRARSIDDFARDYAGAFTSTSPAVAAPARVPAWVGP